MQVERTEGSEHKCWLTEDEANAIIDVASDRSHKHEAVTKAGLRMGLRANEFTKIRPRHMHEINGQFFLRIPEAKDTREEGEGKSRDAYLPRTVEHTLLRL